YAANPQDLPAGITVADTLPLYMTVITTVPSAALTTGGDGRQTAAFSPASLPAGDTRFVITAKASGAASGAGALVNSATVTYGNRSAASNKTYHTIKNVNFGITKHIDKPAVGDQTFVFLIKRADDAFSTPTATFYGVVTVPSGETSATQTFADCPAGYYTVSEEQSNWRYAPDPAYPGYAAAQTASIYAPSYGQFTFYNRIARENWLAGKATVDNTMVKE
ncbi:MAG: hypothetical protein FWC55_10635, partial [Firmicutes bacterium]|nr:hypothetical protein [Bacillota bacterium]